MKTIFTYLTYLMAVSVLLLTSSCKKSPDSAPDYENPNKKIIPVGEAEDMVLSSPPNVPEPVGNRPAKRFNLDLEIIEHEQELDDGVRYLFWTFGGSVPGSFIRGRVGDVIDFTLKNHPDNKLPHNIDLHAVTGQGGGAEASFVAPGHSKTFEFKLINPGLYVYHCATAPVGMHIANGMYGLILVEPEGGLPPVDKEFYVMQGDFYTKGKNGERGFQPFDMQKAYDEQPDYVVFNGNVSGLTGDNAIKAEVGERIRLFVGNGGPNLVSSFHVIGEIFDKVYLEGGSKVNENVQTTLIPAGGAAIVEFTAEVPSNLVLVDHSIFRAFNKGALGILEVSGKNNGAVFKGEVLEVIYLPEGPTIQESIVPEGEKAEVVKTAFTKDERIAAGEIVYKKSCMACHQTHGKGVANAFPPLANADYLNADVDRAIEVVLHGLSGEIKVNGETINSQMPRQNLTDTEVANVLTYVYNQWGNKGIEVTEEMVKKNK